MNSFRHHPRTRLIFSGIAILALMVGIFVILQLNANPVVPQGQAEDLPFFTKTSLAQYNGEIPDLPIYLALDGYVYDVTPGKEFYVPGGTYHHIAGKDASQELKVFGGNLIREKYSIVGKFTPE
ncbi:MAG: hypothetical protein A2408_00355 [Candidatus Yonathbacteria bacterium RIFOXYC1_FULL_52_10]|uniref:Cytochrome b5 heme-binding domain-containing protein n=1 Tax=Candidatus Yonathbacteria bacterium RIFOXYD1_FULL_52_36 TaxID=1802730 RepID=A0A1G2SMD5_9BACT|nr:MAG: hypothetical protein A2408_00355 [Candidatus Yonathbacteria bacterium RIFOXYC1_FULL_52_10]OHA86263.1 MAG: hypothetical protein A2591_01725 [Candidatus Yonathbacteria bacterium RIFOXYD1_FULL_52_36]